MMSMNAATVRRLAQGAIALATLTLVASLYAWSVEAEGQSATVVIWISIALGGLWLVSLQQGWGWTASLELLAFVSLSALSAWLGASAVGTLFAVVAALIAWDLQRFIRRLQRARRVEAEAPLVETHLRRLAIIGGLGLLLGGIALIWHVQLSFWWTLSLSLIALVGLHQALKALRRGGEF
jgi:hypothetical protein